MPPGGKMPILQEQLFLSRVRTQDFISFAGCRWECGEVEQSVRNERWSKISADKCSGGRMPGRHRAVILSVLALPPFGPFPSLSGKRAIDTAWVFRVFRRQNELKCHAKYNSKIYPKLLNHLQNKSVYWYTSTLISLASGSGTENRWS